MKFPFYLRFPLLLVALLLLHGCFLTSPGHAQEGISYFEMRYDPPRIARPLVKISVNGKEPENFILDTGSGFPLIVTEKYARQAKLPPLKLTATVNKAGRMSSVKVDTLHLTNNDDQPVELQGTRVAWVTDADLASLAPKEDIAGIIGIGLFEHCQAEVDFKGQMLILYGMPEAFHPPHVTPLPLVQRSDGLYQTFLFPEVKVPILIDTGAGSGILRQDALDAVSGKTPSYSLYWKVEGIYLLKTVATRSLTVAGATVQNAPFEVWPAAFGKDKLSLVGMQILENLRLTFDIPHNQLYVEFNPCTRVQNSGADSGALLTTDGKAIRVLRLEKDSPASRAGMKIGDVIIAVDKVSVAGKSAAAVQQILDGMAGEEALVDVQRDTVRQLHFTRTKTFRSQQAPYPCFTGLVARLIYGKPMEIAEVAPDSPFARAGVRAGEQVIAINGKTLAQQKSETLLTLLKVPQATITVRGKNNQVRTRVVRSSTAETTK